MTNNKYKNRNRQYQLFSESDTSTCTSMAHNTSLGALGGTSCTGYYKDLHTLDTL